jgi:hypothetical protein
MQLVEKSVTITGTDGEPQTLKYAMTGRVLTAKRERFAELVAYGMVPLDAYCEAYGKTITCDMDRRALQSSAGVLMNDTDVKVRIQELRRPIQRKLAKKWEYSIDHALEDCQRAWDVAHADGDSKAMQSCIRLRAELTKLLKTETNITHNHLALDEETTEVLIALRETVRRRKVAVKVIGGNSGGEKGELIAGPPNGPLVG